MVIALERQWIWDSWYAHDGDTLARLLPQGRQVAGDPELRHFNVSQGHASATIWSIGSIWAPAFAPSEGPAWDDYTTWTGSVVQDDDGAVAPVLHRHAEGRGGLYQRIGHATSTDLHNWTRVGDGLASISPGPNAALRSRTCPRLLARSGDARPLGDARPRRRRLADVSSPPACPGQAEPNAGGAIGFATSPDLVHWTLQPPVFRRLRPAGSAAGLRGGGRWYCLFCTAAEHFSKDRPKPRRAAR
jgi:beta-fructofuranosidase